MQRLLRAFGRGSLAGLALLGAAAAALQAAQPALSGLQGAWLEQSLPCGDVFTSSGKGSSGKSLAFKRPASMFAPAFIISGNRISTPFASCRIVGVKPAGARQALTLGCTTAIASEEVRALVSLADDGTLLRYLNDNDTTGSRYQRCTPKDASGSSTSR